LRVWTKIQALSRRPPASERLTPEQKRLHVMVGVLMDDAGRALIAQRAAGKPHAGAWEFPGGKLEGGEDRLAGLARELREELGITIESTRPLIKVEHTYSYGHVLLDVCVVRHFSGHLSGLDGQALHWCLRRDLMGFGLLPADRPIVAALGLPERLREFSCDEYVVAAPEEATRHADLTQLRGTLCRGMAEARLAARAGAGFIVLSSPLRESELAELCADLTQPVYAVGMELEAAWRLGATGLNLLGL
jgi:mutator protein MutT